MTVRRINEFHATAAREDEPRQFLGRVVTLVAAAPGCESCELFVDPIDPGRFLVLESWSDVEAHQAAASRVPPDMYAAFQQLIAEPPRGRYCAPLA
jgi:quinol monooxygenase YgiN